ncbi:hypothetical protein ACQP3L_33370, partial [Escherichia coli]
HKMCANNKICPLWTNHKLPVHPCTAYTNCKQTWTLWIFSNFLKPEKILRSHNIPSLFHKLLYINHSAKNPHLFTIRITLKLKENLMK